MVNDLGGSVSTGPSQLLESVYVMSQTFDGMTVRGVAVRGTKKILVFDTLVFPQLTTDFAPMCEARDVVIVYSHADWDHVWGTCGLPPGEVIAHEECAKRFLDSDGVVSTLEKYRSKYPQELQQITIVPPTTTFRSRLELDLGGITVELRHCPGHTKDSILAIVPERGLLLGADCIETPFPLLNEDAKYLERWVENLSEIERDTRIEVCIPSHGEIGGRELLTANIAYLRALHEGREWPLSSEVDAFYREGHAENVEKVAMR